MQNLFDTATYLALNERINKLTPATSAQWGKMNVAQMFAHCKETFKVPLSDKRLPRVLLGRIFGWMVKSKLYNETPWKQNLPTGSNLLIRDERDFEKEKQELLEYMKKFYAAEPMGISKHPHPIFGSFTPEQWGQSMFKHMDHHLTQFGV